MPGYRQECHQLPSHQYPAFSDASAGAALLAGIGAGIYASPQDAVARTERIVTEVVPDPHRHQGYVELRALYREVQQRLAPIDHALGRVLFT